MKFVKWALGIYFLMLASLAGAQFLQGEVSPGVYKPIQVDRYGYIISADQLSAIALTDTSAIRRVTGLGHNPEIQAGSVPEDIWSGGGLYPWMTAATSLELVSDNAADASAGTGARSVAIGCLDINYVEIATQLVVPTGVSAVPIPTACFRINSALIMSAGSTGTNVGNLIIRDAGGGTTRAIIPAGYGIIRQSAYTVPAGHTLQIVSIYIAALKNSGASAVFDVATYFRSSQGFYRLPITLTNGVNGSYRHDGMPGITAAEKTDFALRVTSTSATADITGAWLGILRRNTP